MGFVAQPSLSPLENSMLWRDRVSKQAGGV